MSDFQESCTTVLLPVLCGTKVFPQLTLSVPVCRTEGYLEGLLGSIADQLLFVQGVAGLSFEVLIVHDASSASSFLNRLVRRYKKCFASLGGTIRLVEHGKNLGTLEARRSAVLYAQGKYLAFVDPDDMLPLDALQNLYDAAFSADADIVHGKMSYVLDSAGCATDSCILYTDEKLKDIEAKIKNVHIGSLGGAKILDDFLLGRGHNGLICGKLFRTELLRAAFDDIPHTFCAMAEDLIVYFFTLLYAGSYIGIDKIVYNYYLGRGITSNKEITDIAQWEHACSAASAFTVIFSYLEEHPFSAPNAAALNAALQNLCRSHLMMNLSHFKRLNPALRLNAYNILCDYWGEDLVKKYESTAGLKIGAPDTVQFF